MEVWRSSGDGLVGGAELVYAPDPRLPESRPASSCRRSAGSRSRCVLGCEDDVRSATLATERADRPPAPHHRYFLTPHGWKVARLMTRLEARVFRPALAAFAPCPAALPP